MGRSTLNARKLVVAIQIAALDGDQALVAGLQGLRLRSAASGKIPSDLYPISKNTDSAFTAITVACSCLLPSVLQE